MSRRHHHIGREPRTEIRLDPLGESLLDALEVETRARAAYDVAELQAVTELNIETASKQLGHLIAEVEPTPWSETDPETRRDYRRQVVQRMHRAGQLVGDRAAKGYPVEPHPLPGGQFDESSTL